MHAVERQASIFRLPYYCMILGVESSCDESALCLYHPKDGVVENLVHSQVSKHADYGGVVPDLAVREHLENFFPLLDLTRNRKEFGESLEMIAVTCGPGLIGCLGVGLSIAKTLGQLWDIPVFGVNHLRGHAYSPFMKFTENHFTWSDWLPHLGLLISGGNTLLFEISTNQSIEILGRTRDDAVGEALDKGAKLLGIPYPGGAELERKAKRGDTHAFAFPRAFQGKESDDFSFSGLKTSLLYTLQKMTDAEVRENIPNLCASYQQAAVEQLDKKCKRFLSAGKYRSFGLSGGVANNQAVRLALEKSCIKSGVNFLPAEPNFTGDNAAMIAHAAYRDPEGLWSNRNGCLNFHPGLRLGEQEVIKD